MEKNLVLINKSTRLFLDDNVISRSRKKEDIFFYYQNIYMGYE